MTFEEIEHTADRAFRVQGRNFAELLENAARAMSSFRLALRARGRFRAFPIPGPIAPR